jgi:hypothetical protein
MNTFEDVEPGVQQEQGVDAPDRTNRVVVRSLAEFCLALDTALAVAIVIVTVRQ